ncbi:MAG: gliding motility-associated ABC transporter ATP-binding subunit GldA [Bacteroidales bacterium]|nr:gliding motility-associated ABC transporter ATP-binding subunit GldA [Bacteroidales bacterium]MBN2748053.1 gliding motility-associated ABC transporter ATP-binding subunit GldA [Bacteroidales bacterium]
MSITVSNITKIYGEQKALNGVSFSINTGQVVGFLGPNGAGKSTMMKIISGFIPPTTGEVLVSGTSIFSSDYDFRRNVGYLPENNPLYTDMYVKEYLLFVARIYGLGSKSNQRVKELIDLTGIGYEQNKRIGSLSKGYRQRVGMAQALMHDPEVLILDEPTSGLDPNQIVEIRRLITEVGREKTVMLSTHIMQEVEAICQRIIIINRGNLIADGSNSEILALSSSKGQSVQVEFTQDIDFDTLKGIAGVSYVKAINAKSAIVSSQLGADIRPNIFNFAVAKGLTLVHLEEKGTHLEDIFQTLTMQPE